MELKETIKEIKRIKNSRKTKAWVNVNFRRVWRTRLDSNR